MAAAFVGYSGSDAGSSSDQEKVDQNDDNWDAYLWKDLCNCQENEMKDCECPNNPRFFAFDHREGEWHVDVLRLMSELADKGQFDIDQLTDAAHFNLETLPVKLCIQCLEIFRRVGGSDDASFRVECEAERIRKTNNITTPDEPDIYRKRVKAPVKASVCNGGAAAGADAPEDTESESEDAGETGAGASVGEKKKRTSSLGVLQKKVKRNMAAIHKNTEEYRTNRAAAVELKAARTAMLQELDVPRAKAKQKKTNKKTNKSKH
jgi:hypothetical protein